MRVREDEILMERKIFLSNTDIERGVELYLEKFEGAVHSVNI